MSSIGKPSYVNAKFKRSVQEEMIPKGKFKKVVGLGGPDIAVWQDFYLSKGFVWITSYETNYERWCEQYKARANSCTIIHGDIMEAHILPGTWYDIDLCCRVDEQSKPLIQKFINNCSFTFTTRSCLKGDNKEAALSRFFSYRNEKELNRIYEDTLGKRMYIETNGGLYRIMAYREPSGSPMMTITKIRKTILKRTIV